MQVFTDVAKAAGGSTTPRRCSSASRRRSTRRSSCIAAEIGDVSKKTADGIPLHAVRDGDAAVVLPGRTAGRPDTPVAGGRCGKSAGDAGADRHAGRSLAALRRRCGRTSSFPRCSCSSSCTCSTTSSSTRRRFPRRCYQRRQSRRRDVHRSWQMFLERRSPERQGRRLGHVDRRPTSNTDLANNIYKARFRQRPRALRLKVDLPADQRSSAC